MYFCRRIFLMASPNFLSNSFRPFVKLSLVFTFLVILAGSVVRTTQSGMGCPDWPKCFGYYIPPTDPSQVDFHPQHAYTKGMMVIVNDTLWRATAPFKSGDVFNREQWEKYPKHNYAKFFVRHTWIEYINRLLGAIMGILVLGACITSFFQKTHKRLLVGLGLLLVFFTGFQAWLGALVVASHLAPVKITTHMLAALLLLAIIQWMIELSKPSKSAIESNQADRMTRLLALTAISFTIIQVLLGTQVREAIDIIANELGHEQRELWIERLPSSFLIHRAFSLMVLAVNTFLLLRAMKFGNARQARFAMLSGFITLAEITVGIALAMWDMPEVAQPMHLVLASLLFSAQFAILLASKSAKPSESAITSRPVSQ